MHGAGDRVVPAADGRYLAASIAGARYEEYPGEDHIAELSSSWRQIHDILLEFVLQRRPDADVHACFATVLFTDLVDSTRRSAALGDRAWGELLDTHDRLSGEVVRRCGGSVVKQTGDGMLATFPDPGEAVRAALTLTRQLGEVGLPIRAGLHAGRIEVRDDADISGITVNIAARVQALAAGGDVLVSRTVRDLLLGEPYRYLDRGGHELKGVDGVWQLYQVVE